MSAGREETVRCLLLFGETAQLALEGAEDDDPARWPASAISADTGLDPGEIPGRRFRVLVADDRGRLAFAGFRLLP